MNHKKYLIPLQWALMLVSILLVAHVFQIYFQKLGIPTIGKSHTAMFIVLLFALGVIGSLNQMFSLFLEIGSLYKIKNTDISFFIKRKEDDGTYVSSIAYDVANGTCSSTERMVDMLYSQCKAKGNMSNLIAYILITLSVFGSVLGILFAAIHFGIETNIFNLQMKESLLPIYNYIASLGKSYYTIIPTALFFGITLKTLQSLNEQKISQFCLDSAIFFDSINHKNKDDLYVLLTSIQDRITSLEKNIRLMRSKYKNQHIELFLEKDFLSKEA